MPLLELLHVSVRYHDAKQPVLTDVSFSLNERQLLVVLGPSGSGKTTLLNLIAGYSTPSDGQLLLEGHPIEGPGPDRGVVFQHDVLLPWQNVLENVAFGLVLSGVRRDQREQIAQTLLEQVGLKGYEYQSIWQLSGGQRQRVGIARALAANPRLLLMDEPFGALDAFTREQMQELLLKVWNESSKPILLITHDIEEAIFLGTDLILMSPRPGRIVERLSLPFSRRYTAGERARAIKSDPAFIKMREHVLDRVFTWYQQEAAS